MDRKLAAWGLAVLAFAGPPAFAQAPDPQGSELKPRSEDFLLVGKGELKSHSLLDSSVICDFKKFIRGVPGVDSSRLLAFRFARDLRVEQVRGMFREVVKGQAGYAPADLEALLRVLGPAAKGGTLELRWGTGPVAEVRTPGAVPIQVNAASVADAVWTGLGEGRP